MGDATDTKESFGSTLFWRIVAVAIFVCVLWILWLLWQISPRSAVNPIVFQLYQNRQTSSGAIQGSPGARESGGSGEAGGVGAKPAEPLSSGAPLENLRIETELKGVPQSAPK